jgi:hypothetical protein
MQNAIAAVPSVRVARARDRRGAAGTILFKVDHARAIDRYIDYFGSSSPAPLVAETTDRSPRLTALA